MLERLFEKSHIKLSKSESQKVVSLHIIDLAFHFNFQKALEIAKETLEDEFKVVALLYRRFKNLAQLIELITDPPKNQLSIEPVEELDTFENNNGKSFIDQLIDNNETYRIGSLVKRIWSGMNIPMSLNNPGNQPVGGISDITNKGNFHSLLISEFGFDDDIFISRLLNNESLYIERESPPNDGVKNRVFLIDQSIKNWGVPKTLAHAVAVAIAAHPRSEFEAQAYTLGTACIPFDIFDVAHIARAQTELNATLTMLPSLKEYFDKYHQETDEVFLFTFQHNPLIAALQQEDLPIDYLVTTDTSGTVKMERLLKRNAKSLKKLFIPYEELWYAATPKPINNLPSSNILRDQKQPDSLLLEPLNRSTSQMFWVNDLCYVLQNGNLFIYLNDYKALSLLITDVVQHNNSLFALGRNQDQEIEFVEFNAFAKAYTITNLKTQKKESFKLKKTTAGHAHFRLFIYGRKLYLKINDELLLLNRGVATKVSSGIESYAAKKVTNHEKSKKKTVNKIFKYNSLTNFENLSLRGDNSNIYLQLGNWILYDEELIQSAKFRIFFKMNSAIEVEKKVNLYLKKADEKDVSVLCNYLDIIPQEAKKFVNTTPTILKKGMMESEALELKKKLENSDLVCFLKNSAFVLSNGNRIEIVGQKLRFINSILPDKSFVMTPTIGVKIAFGSKKHTAGNNHFIPANDKRSHMKIKDFKEHYFYPFIKS